PSIRADGVPSVVSEGSDSAVGSESATVASAAEFVSPSPASTSPNVVSEGPQLNPQPFTCSAVATLNAATFTDTSLLSANPSGTWPPITDQTAYSVDSSITWLLPPNTSGGYLATDSSSAATILDSGARVSGDRSLGLLEVPVIKSLVSESPSQVKSNQSIALVKCLMGRSLD
ncbi:unnamed protein product, partial [Protopolystoma xenopodis]